MVKLIEEEKKKTERKMLMILSVVDLGVDRRGHGIQANICWQNGKILGATRCGQS
jgi:hypothetical protein